MKDAPGMEALSLDQAPPLALPFLFFAVAPVALVVAGLLLLEHGAGALASPWRPETLTLTHLGTLGFLGSVMFGALYQMSPVVAGTPVAWLRHAWVVWGLHAVGLALLVAWGFGGPDPAGASPWLGFHVLATGVMLLCGAVGWALARTKVKGPTVWGMRLAVGALFLAMTMGTFLVGHWTPAGSMLGPDRVLGLEVHVGLALLGWVGGLLTAVSWQVVPMFYLTPEAQGERPWLVLLALAGSVAGAVVVQLLVVAGQLEGAGRVVAAVVLAPGAVALWLWHPTLVWGLIARRRRRRADPSARFWLTGMAAGPVTGALAAATVLLDVPWTALAFVWCAVLGWAGLVVHGMLTRIGPFLVWFHRFSSLVGLVPTPTARRMLPDGLVWTGYGLHLAALVLGLAAIVTGSDLAAGATGVALVGLGGVLGAYLVILWRLRPDDGAAALVGPADAGGG